MEARLYKDVNPYITECFVFTVPMFLNKYSSTPRLSLAQILFSQFQCGRRDVHSPPMLTRFEHSPPSCSSDGHDEQCNEDMSSKNVKSSADSGLGSSEIDEQQHWKNGTFKLNLSHLCPLDNFRPFECLPG